MFFYPLIKMHALFKHTLPKSLFKFVWRQLERAFLAQLRLRFFVFISTSKGVNNINNNNKELVFEEHSDYIEENANMYTVVSVRISKKVLKELEEIQMKTSLSRNALIREYVKFGLEHTRLVKREPE